MLCVCLSVQLWISNGSQDEFPWIDDNAVCIADERESVQKKTFMKWVNSHLARTGSRISDLYVDLRDGKMLLRLLEVLSGERLGGAKFCLPSVFLASKLAERAVGNVRLCWPFSIPL